MDNNVNGMNQAGQASDATCVFRVPSSDVTMPDLMASATISSPVLSIVKGPQTGAAFELEDAVTTIGRDPANSIFLNDMTVSRSHAKILRDAGGVRIEDLGSLNGTWVDGAIVNEAPIHDGSSIQIGTFTLIYHESTPERIETGE